MEHPPRRVKLASIFQFVVSTQIITNAQSLFRNKKFMLDEMTQRNTSKFVIFLEYENPGSFFRFSFRAFLSFYFMNAPVYVDIEQGIHK